VRTDDRKNYIKALHQSDLLTGKEPFSGANATLKQAKPLVDYIANIVETKLIAVLQLINGEIVELIEAKDTTVNDIVEDNSKGGQKSGRKRWSEILDLIKDNPSVSRKELSETLGINPSAIQKHIQKLKNEGFIERVGGDRGGYWKVLK
jgi:predicted HTH transcriptional regulator